MRTSGGRGSEAFITAVPVIALIAAVFAAQGGADGIVAMLERTIRTTVTAVIGFLSRLL